MLSDFNLFLKKLSTKKIAFIGLGISNLNIINFLISKLIKPSSLTVLDLNTQNSSNEKVLNLKNLGVNFIFGENYLKNLTNFNVVIRSPGVYFNKPEIQSAIKKGVILTSEMELFFSFCPCKTIAITGSDGKTTTTSLIAAMLKAQGFRVHLGGNIGKPLFDCIEQIKPSDFAVIELSSFQLISMNKSPNIAVITNISPNHLDVHKNMEEYVNAKLNLIKYQNEFNTTIINADNSYCAQLERKTRGFVKHFSAKHKVENGAFFNPVNKNIYYSKNSKKVLVLNSNEIVLPGFHNIENYLAAISAIFEIVSINTIKSTAKNFKGVEHRLEFVLERNKIKWFNDSIATTPTRTIAAINCFESKKIILIAGGYDKKIEFDALAEKILTKVKILILLGATAKKITQCLKNNANFKTTKNFKIINVQNMEQAIKAATIFAKEGDFVVLSPACASFDMYNNFEERGLHFKNILKNNNF